MSNRSHLRGYFGKQLGGNSPQKPINQYILIIGILSISFILLIVLAIVLTPIIGTISDQSISQEVIIPKGEYAQFSSNETHFDEIEITLNITSQETKKFDLYIQSENQYFDSYGGGEVNSSPSYLFSYENISSIMEKIPWTEKTHDTIYIVIDNNGSETTTGDASPDGVITLDVNILIRTRWGIGWD